MPQYTEVAAPFTINNASGVDVSLAVSMAGANSVQLNVTTVVMPSGQTMTIAIEGSNDLENWVTVVSFGSLGLGYIQGIKKIGVPWQYVRLRYTAGTGSPYILFAGIYVMDATNP